MESASFFNLKRYVDVCMIIVCVMMLFTLGCAHQQTDASPPPPESSGEPAVVILPPAETPMEYRMGPGDVLEISVWKNQDLSRVVVVLPDGTITFPLVGRFVAGGKTVRQLRDEMEKKISRYVPEPELSIIVQQVNSMVVYVIGKVNRPGFFPLTRNIDVLQVLSMAGGLNIFADPTDIRIFRKTPDNNMVMTFDYKRATENNSLDNNIVLQAGDVVVVK